jgi:hypothetical protein
MPRAVHQRSIRAFAVDKMLEHVGQQAGQDNAEEHAVGFAADVFSLWSKPARSQNSPTTANRIFSSASQVITRSVRSRSGVAARAQRLLIAISTRVGANVMRP